MKKLPLQLTARVKKCILRRTMQNDTELVIHTDGGSRGNPGPAGIGVLIERGGKQLAAIGKYIGETTNNVAEYTAVLTAWEWISKNSPEGVGYTAINFYLDSELVVHQINGKYKAKDMKMRELLMRVKTLSASIQVPVKYTPVRREMNADADRLVNQALDSR